jgi:Undecaprenyl-phosphate galactose phosphotransferase WbaP
MLRYEPFVAQPTAEGLEVGIRDTLIRPNAWHVQWQKLSHVLKLHAVLFFCDVAALLSSAALGYLLWAYPVLHQPASLYLVMLPLFCLLPLSYATGGLYPGFGLGPVETLRRLSYSTSISFLVLAAASFAFKADSRYSRVTFAVTWLASLAIVPIFRFAALSILKAFRWWREPTAIFGTVSQIKLTIRSLENAFSLGYEVVGVLCSDRKSVGRRVGDFKVLGGLELIPELVKRGVTTMLAWDSPSAASQLAQTQQQLHHIVFIREEKLLPVERVQVRNLGGVLGIEFTNELLRQRNQLIKRTIDLVVAAGCLVVALPVIAVSALLIKIVSPGPAFYRQEREGLHGSKFTVWKLRTMYPDAEARLAVLLTRDPELNRQWQRSVKLPQDPRLIPVLGAFLRRLSVDELPQLWSVVSGKMSLVGPRPFPEYHLRLLSPECKRFRRTVLPGLTGMWQVMMRGDGDVSDQERLDVYYIRNWSLWLDLYILAKTVSAVVLGRGAY